MPPFWNKKKCLNGHPAHTPTEAEAKEVVDLADFSKAIYVNISAEQGRTKQAFTFVDFGKTWTFCVCGHAHLNAEGEFTGGGNAYIPGLGDFETKLDNDVARTIYAQALRGSWSDVELIRYPRRRV